MKIKYDLHIHSCLSPCGDNDMTPNNIAGMAKLGGVQIAALTDHNTSLNCPAFFEACERYGVVPIAGMELTTLEEIHLVCLFPTLQRAMEFDAFVAQRRMRIKNKPSVFGDQIIMNSKDEIIGREEMLLIPATELDLSSAADAVRSLGGTAFPAHIEKPSNSILPILGTFPEDPEFAAAEIFNVGNTDALRTKYPLLKKLTLVKNSDAHALDDMPLEPSAMDIGECEKSPEALRKRLIDVLCGRR